VTDRPGFERELMNFLKHNEVDFTFSVGDVGADILARNQEEVSKYTRIIAPEYRTFIRGADKWNLMEYCMDRELPCPKTIVLNEETIETVQASIKFPAIVKPTRGVGAIGVVRVNNQDELHDRYRSLKNKHENLIVQEYIPLEGGKQYMAEAFVDEKGIMKVCVVIYKARIFPVKAGTSSANVTVSHPEIVETTRRLLESLNWRGAADVDFMLDPRDNVAKILEINPRVTAGIKIGFVAGVDYADLYLKLAFGQNVPAISEYKLGVYSRNFFLEILWFLFSDAQMKRNTKPSFYKFFGKDVVDQVFSLDDPLTGLGFFLNMVRKYMNVKNFKKKFNKR
jgi:predicted ATP-grasp superfamily ATP-dependent carboligase